MYGSIHGFLYFYSDIHLIFKIFISFKIDWLGITPYVYGVSDRQRNDIPRQVGCMGCGL